MVCPGPSFTRSDNRQSSLGSAGNIAAVLAAGAFQNIFPIQVEHMFATGLTAHFSGQMWNFCGRRRVSANLQAPDFQATTKIQKATPKDLRTRYGRQRIDHQATAEKWTGQKGRTACNHVVPMVQTDQTGAIPQRFTCTHVLRGMKWIGRVTRRHAFNEMGRRLERGAELQIHPLPRESFSPGCSSR